MRLVPSAAGATSIVTQVPAGTIFQALPCQSTVDDPAQEVPGPAAQSFLPASDTPKHFSIIPVGQALGQFLGRQGIGLGLLGADKVAEKPGDQVRQVIHDQIERGHHHQLSTVDTMMPPITAVAIGARKAPPSPTPSAEGSMPADMAMEVITMGWARLCPASITA
jgi:hypothetical protein